MATGKPENVEKCPLCGGRLKRGVATIPFVFPDTVVVVKDVPALICVSCQEPFTNGEVTDNLTDLLNRARDMKAETLIISYSDAQAAASAI
jgi:YgiT-type zinc finger domain-containing protein